MDTPFFSVLITNYNYAAMVGEAIDSVLAQDYPRERFEVIVVDDGSTDDSRAVLAGYAGHPQVRVICTENRGQSAAFESACDAARGDFVCLLDSDDLFRPHKLTRLAAHLGTLPGPRDTLFLCHDLEVQDAQGMPVRDGSWFRLLGIGGDSLALSEATRDFPFSVPAGLVFARALLAEVLAAMPTWAFPRGTDGVICPAALMRCGRVHYLHERLAVYRVHGGNEFASVVDGAFTPRFDPRVRKPRTLAFLERFADDLALDARARAEVLDYLRRFERSTRSPSARLGLGVPVVAVAVFDTGDAAALRRSVDALITQTHARLVLVVPAGADLPALPPADGRGLARALAAAPADFHCFLRAGDRLDPVALERHLFWHQQSALVGVTVSDVRLAGPEGQLLHADVFAGSGAWKQAVQHIPPHAARLADWVGAPPAACVFRAGTLFTRAMAEAAADPALAPAGFWLAFQFQLHCAGALRVRESLATCALPDAAAASYGYVSAAQRLDGGVAAAPARAMALWWQEHYLDHEEDFRRWLPDAWHRRFEPWLDAHTAAAPPAVGPGA